MKRKIIEAWHISCGLAVLFTVISCSREKGEFELLQGLPLPKEAYEVQKLHLYDSPKNQQLFFKIDRRYPMVDVFNLYNGYFGREKWIICNPSYDKFEWDWFLDKSSKPPRYVHQVVSYWIDPERRLFASVSGHYSSATLGDSNVPDNLVQRWAVIVQKNVNILEEVKRLHLSCKYKSIS